MHRIKKGGLLNRRGIGVGAEYDTVTVPEQHRLIEVQESERSGVCADLVRHPCKIDDADVMALLAQLERTGLEPLIDGSTAASPIAWSSGGNWLPARAESGCGQRVEDNRADPLVEGGVGKVEIGLDDLPRQLQRTAEQGARIGGVEVASRVRMSLSPIMLTSAECAEGGCAEVAATRSATWPGRLRF